MISGLGTMLERFLEAKSCIQHVPTSIQVPKATYFYIFQNHVSMCLYIVCLMCTHYMHVLHVCITGMQYIRIICMYVLQLCIAMYSDVSQLCIMAMYHSYVLQLCIIAIYYSYLLQLCIIVVHCALVRQKPCGRKGHS